MVAARIVAPQTKLATTRWWHTTTLAEDFGVAEASEGVSIRALIEPAIRGVIEPVQRCRFRDLEQVAF
jgi:hypothetical protein